MKKEFFIGRKRIGWLQDGIFRKEVQGSVHMFRMFRAWGVDYDVLRQLTDDVQVRIRDSETGIVYVTTARRMRRWGSVLRFKNETNDWGAQVFLLISYFDTVKNSVETISEIAKWQDEMWDLFEKLSDKKPEPPKTHLLSQPVRKKFSTGGRSRTRR